MKWYCIRCEQDVDYEAFRCGCTESPSPWIPKVEISFEKVEVKASSRKLEGWTVEYDEPIWDCSDEFREAMETEIDPNIKN